ncbi:MAG: 4Fe-4S dicluster domain-containing protein [Dehalococcoidia bacterium]|nr:4Fe-4S dicluster domain-containing protein [Dehalococcoidia bacterium]
MAQFISRKDLLTWLAGLLQHRTVVAPVIVQGNVLFRPIERTEQIVFTSEKSVIPPKEWFFRQNDVLFTVLKKDSGTEISPTVMEREAVLFGIRPCDAHGMAIIDNVFLGNPADALYAERRAKTTLVGLACIDACPGGFCSSMGGGPQDPSRLDIMLTEAGDGFIVQVITEKGNALLASARLSDSSLQAAAPPELDKAPAVGIAKPMERFFNHEYWSRVADRCIGCQICTYVCPTCHCFDVRDYQAKGKIERLRTWDGCQSALFNRIAGGHNPRPNRTARLRQRFAHKLLYFPKDYQGVLGCSGCGRCVVRCPVNIDIREVISDMQKLGVENAVGSA